MFHSLFSNQIQISFKFYFSYKFQFYLFHSLFNYINNLWKISQNYITHYFKQFEITFKGKIYQKISSKLVMLPGS